MAQEADEADPTDANTGAHEQLVHCEVVITKGGSKLGTPRADKNAHGVDVPKLLVIL